MSADRKSSHINHMVLYFLLIVVEGNLILENTEARVYLRHPLRLSVFKHLALQAYH